MHLVCFYFAYLLATFALIFVKPGRGLPIILRKAGSTKRLKVTMAETGLPAYIKIHYLKLTLGVHYSLVALIWTAECLRYILLRFKLD